MLSCSDVSNSVTLCTVAHQAPLSMGFPREECWSGLPRPPPGDLPNPGLKPVSLNSPALASRFYTTSTTPGKVEVMESKMFSITSPSSSYKVNPKLEIKQQRKFKNSFILLLIFLKMAIRTIFSFLSTHHIYFVTAKSQSFRKAPCGDHQILLENRGHLLSPTSPEGIILNQDKLKTTT